MTVPAPKNSWNFRGRPTAFIGRVKEMHRLREAVRNVIESRRRRAVLLLGSAGIGKSRLLIEFFESLDEHVDSVTTLTVACRRDGGPPYSVFQRLLKARFYIKPQVPLESAREQLKKGLIQIFKDPELGEEAAHFIGHLVGLRFPRSKHILKVDADPRRIKEHAIELLAQMLRIDANRRPMVICVDNLHLASPESLSLLLKLSSLASDSPILFLAAARKTLIQHNRRFVETVRHVGEVIDVVGLSDRHCQRIIKGLLSRSPEVPAPFAKVLLEKAFGNPLQLEQIIELYIERGAIQIDGEIWTIDSNRIDGMDVPGTLRDVVRSKLARLSTLERGILEKAATIGDVFWSGCIEIIRRVDEGHLWDDADRFWTTERRSDELLQVTEGLRHRQIVVRNPQTRFSRSKEYVFKHTVEREVLYEGIEGPRRARYHRLIAQWLEAQAAHHRDDLVEQVARHWERGHHPRKAARYYIKAGDRAVERHINTEAIAFYQRALQCLTDDDAMDRLSVFHKLGQVNMVLGEHAVALGHLQEMLRLAWLLDDERQGGQAYNKMGRSYRSLGEYELALEYFKHGLVLFRRLEDIRGIASSADDIGRVHRLRGDLSHAEERLQEGLRLRRYIRDDRGVAESLYHLGNVYTERGDFKQAIGSMREALGLARSVDDQKTVADILTSIGVICFHRGDADKALTLWSEALEISKTLGERQLQGVLLNNSGEILLGLQRKDEAREKLLKAVEILDAVGDRRSLSDALRNLGSLYLNDGDYPTALQFSQQALDAAVEVGALGQAGLAERNLGEVCSRTLYDDTPDRAARISAAEQHFEAAIEHLSEVGLEAELGHAYLGYGRFLAEIGQEDTAKVTVKHAQTLFEKLDMKDALERTRRVLSAL